MTIARGQMKRQLYAEGGVKNLLDIIMSNPEQFKDIANILEKESLNVTSEKMSDDDKEVMENLRLKQMLPEYQYNEQNLYEGPRDMRANGGIPTLRNKYGFGSFVSSITGGIGDILGGAADVVGDVVSGVGDVIGDVDLGDVATAAAFIYGGPQAAAMVNQATGGTGNKYIDTGLQLASLGSSFSGGGSGGVFGTGSGGTFGTPSGIPSIPGVPSDVSRTLQMGSQFIDYGKGPGQIGGQKPSTTGDILGTLINLGTSAYGAYKAKKEQEKENELRRQQYEEQRKRYEEFLAKRAQKRRQYYGEDSLPGLSVSNRGISKSDVLGRRGVASGGILNIRTNSEGVKEIDYRQEGGFVPPVGIKEKADDIPAMLSNNEFVFTADAVRGAGNGNVNEGAKKMYALMKKLESGGRV